MITAALAPESSMVVSTYLAAGKLHLKGAAHKLQEYQLQTVCENKTRLHCARSCMTAALGQADSPASYCRSWRRALDSRITYGGHSWPWQNGPPDPVGRSSTPNLISPLAEAPVRANVQSIASHTCDIVVDVMLNYGLLAKKALRRARARR